MLAKDIRHPEKQVVKNIKDKKKDTKEVGTELCPRKGVLKIERKGVLKIEKFPNTRKHSCC